MLRIYPYKVGSASAGQLRDELGGRIIRLKNSTYRPRDRHVVLNWGNSRTPDWWGQGDTTYLNSPECVAIAADKLRCLEALRGSDVPTVPFTTSEHDAQDWLDDGHKVYARHSLAGHSGDGIVVHSPHPDSNEVYNIAERLDNLGYDSITERLLTTHSEETPSVDSAPLYTRGVTNTGEYRVHVLGGDVILYQKKSRRVDENGNIVTAEGEAADVRNLASNWVYRTGNLRRLERVEDLAVNAVEALGLDFGAVDIIKDEGGNVYVLEVNTAPGLGNSQTLAAYTTALQQFGV